MRKINLIVIHCTATKEGVKQTVADIRRYHKSLGWKDIGYHYVVYADGTVAEGRPVEQAGAHVSGYNANSIGIAYVGGLNKNGKAADTRTEAQKEALHKLVDALLVLYPGCRVVGHRDLSPDKNGNGIIEPNEYVKMCPCFNVADEF